MGENTVGKGENAHYEQFLLFLLCFQKPCSADMYKPGLVWERVNPKQVGHCEEYRRLQLLKNQHFLLSP